MAPTTTTACLRCVRVARGRKPRVAPGRRREDVIHVSPRATDGDVNDGGEPDGDDVARTPRDGADGVDVDVGDGDGEDRADGPVVALALALIRFYRTQISPLTPPACRFVPTCSQYAMDAFRTFGAGKGAVLTAWRLARCTPFGGKGYDPPRWPPVAFNAGSWDDYPGINDPIPDDDADGR